MADNYHFEEKKEPEIVYSKAVKAGKRIYYLDVKKAKNEDLYVCITESKKKSQGEDSNPTFEKHKVFLYKEDFAHFLDGLQDVIDFARKNLGEIEDRQEWAPEVEEVSKSDGSAISEMKQSFHRFLETVTRVAEG